MSERAGGRASVRFRGGAGGRARRRAASEASAAWGRGGEGSGARGRARSRGAARARACVRPCAGRERGLGAEAGEGSRGAGAKGERSARVPRGGWRWGLPGGAAGRGEPEGPRRGDGARAAAHHERSGPGPGAEARERSRRRLAELRPGARRRVTGSATSRTWVTGAKAEVPPPARQEGANHEAPSGAARATGRKWAGPRTRGGAGLTETARARARENRPISFGPAPPSRARPSRNGS